MTDVKVALAADFDREIFWKGGRSVRYLVARVAARREDDGRRGERAALNIALVIDASGSMRGDKLEAARAAAQGLAERLAPRDRLTIVSFASDVRVHIDAAPVTAGNSTRIQAEISRLETRGMTCLSGGWFAGVECAARVAEEDAGLTPRVIVLSDGLANEGIQDPAELCEHAGELRRRGVLTSALGIGDDYDERLLRGIAENGGGRLHDAETAAEISSVLLGELDDIFLTAVEDAEIAVAAPASARVAFVGTARTRASRGRMAVALGPLQNEIERVAVFKVTCPEGRNGDTLAFEVAASGRAAEGGAARGRGPDHAHRGGRWSERQTGPQRGPDAHRRPRLARPYRRRGLADEPRRGLPRRQPFRSARAASFRALCRRLRVRPRDDSRTADARPPCRQADVVPDAQGNGASGGLREGRPRRPARPVEAPLERTDGPRGVAGLPEPRSCAPGRSHLEILRRRADIAIAGQARAAAVLSPPPCQP